MNSLLFQTTRALPMALVFAAAAALSTGAHANEASKKALAIKLAQLQQRNSAPGLINQITDGAVQEIIPKWAQQVQTRVPADKQQDISNKLNAELKKFGDSTHQAVEAQAPKTAQDALVPVFLDKLSEEELKTIVTYLETPASAKFAALGSDAANVWAKKIVEGTQAVVQGYAKTFDAAAEKIISAAASSAPIAPPAAPAATPPASSASEAAQ
jgi:hypothetical protein